MKRNLKLAMLAYVITHAASGQATPKNTTTEDSNFQQTRRQLSQQVASLTTQQQALQQENQHLKARLAHLPQKATAAKLTIRRHHTLIVPSEALPDDEIIANGCLMHGIEQLATIQDALTCIADLGIGGSGSVTIELKQTPTTPYDTIEVAHANGDRIQLIGNCQGPCAIEFKPGQDGLLIQNGHHLGKLADFKFSGHGEKYGIYVRNQSALIDAENIEVSHFGNGVTASLNATISANNIQVITNSIAGVHSTLHGSIMLTGNNLIQGNSIRDINADAGYIHCHHCTYETKSTYNYGVIWDY